MLEPLQNDTDFISFIVKKFYRGSLNFDLKPEHVQELTEEQQEQFLSNTTQSELLKKYPVKSEFSRLFLKKLINVLENNQQEVHDDLYTALCTTMKSNNNDDFCYRHYIIGNDLNNIITLRETNNMVVNGTTGMRTWEAAIMLADWALSNVQEFENKSVLELGAGIGFTGITMAKHCKTKNMMLTDCHDDVLTALENNIHINFPSWLCQKNSESTTFTNKNQRIGVMALDWNYISDLRDENYPDVIIGADIIYDPTILEPLINVIQYFIQKNETLKIYIGGVIRNEKTLNMFLERLDSLGLQHHKIEQPRNIFIDWDCKIQRYLLQISKKC